MFVEKLNRKETGVYVIEEEKNIIDGVWEGYLDHDNVDYESVVIYTEPNFAGDKVDNYFISTPSETPWKAHLKVFSNSIKVYITYESKGDQVEAEDINLLQDELVKEINRSTIEDERLDVEVGKKADKTFVNTELNKKYDKEEVFNKDEVLQKMQDLIGAAPEALDTLEELARALDNDPDFATNLINQLATKVDKVEGKKLTDENYTLSEKDKLAGIEDEANKYIHPSTHPADMIVENASKRFVSDTEKSNWNAKETPGGAQEKANQAELNAKTHTDNKVLTDVPANAKFTDTTYSEISTSEIDAGTSSTRRTITGRRIKYILDTIQGWINTLQNIVDGKAEVSDIPTKVGQLENDSGYITQSDLGDAGLGDMLKSEYDTNNNGKVDNAELADSVPWGGVTGKPTTFPPSSHNHDTLYMKKGPVTWNDLKGV